MKRNKWCNRGVAGIFEDLPSLMIILIALAVFISSIFYSTVTYIKAWDKNEKYESCLNIIEGLESYEKLLITGSYTSQPIAGVYSFEKLNDMNTSVMKADIKSRFDYHVSVVDLENSSVSWSFGDEPPSGKVEKITMYNTIVIEIAQNEIHLVQLQVTVW